MDAGNVSTGVENASAESTADHDQEGSGDRGSGQEGAYGAHASGERSPSTQPSNQKTAEELSEEYLDRMVKTKVDGKIVMKSVRDLMKLDQKEQASQARMREAAEIRKQLKMREQREAQLINLLNTDPARFFQVVGADGQKIATDILARKYDLENMSPEQREAEELRQWKAKREEEDKQREEAASLEREQRAQKEMSVHLDRELGEALSASNLPKNKLFIQRTAAKMVESIERVKARLDDAPLQAKEAVAKVIEDWHSDVRETLSTMDAKAIHELLGPQVLKKIRDLEVERVTGQRFSEREGESRPATPAASGKPKTMNEYERRQFMAELREKLPS